ncbi:MAG: thioesterase, partial [Chloroflexota bacterium]|nr:thioesterase [Chloroflexota bacterium]
MGKREKEVNHNTGCPEHRNGFQTVIMSVTVQTTNSWLRISSPQPDARLRLFCFPYAGGGAMIYRAWHQHLPANIEVCAVQLPGREDRIRERPFTNLVELVQALLPHLLPYLDKPFAFFGHSMGALIGYELAQQLAQQPGQVPRCLFVSGRRAPFLPERARLLHTLPTDEILLAELQRRYNNIPAPIFEDAELRALFAPLLRADAALAETYQCPASTSLPCPIVALGGDSDPLVSLAELQGWQTLTQA